MMNKHFRAGALAVGAALALSGCSAPAALRGYLADRVGDALDVFGLQFTIGPSVYAEVQLGSYVHVPVGLAVGGTGWGGLIRGKLTTEPAPATYGFPCSNAFVVATIASDPMMEFDAALVACLLCTKVVDAGDAGYVCLCFVPAKIPSGDERAAPATRQFDLSVELSLGLRVRAAFSPGEAVDFLLGFSGSDVAGDDNRLRLRHPPSESTR